MEVMPDNVKTRPKRRHASESWHPASAVYAQPNQSGIPAFAGMTYGWETRLRSETRGEA